MKIRNGFVSNSSSSSFVAFIPKNFKIETKNVSHEAKLLFKYLVRNDCLYECDLENLFEDDVNKHDEDLGEAYDELTNFLIDNKMILVSVDGQPDHGHIILVDGKTIDEIHRLKEEYEN